VCVSHLSHPRPSQLIIADLMLLILLLEVKKNCVPNPSVTSRSLGANVFLGLFFKHKHTHACARTHMDATLSHLYPEVPTNIASLERAQNDRLLRQQQTKLPRSQQEA
jgi:hypothetical protein